jgi:hypothetical protein
MFGNRHITDTMARDRADAIAWAEIRSVRERRQFVVYEGNGRRYVRAADAEAPEGAIEIYRCM